MPHSRFRSARTAFTLVELLVVISIIGVLMALLLPAVNAARMSALRTACQMRMKDLGKATQLYEAGKKKFPSSLTRKESDPAMTLPWTVRLLPNLDQQKLYDDFVHRPNPVAIYIETLVCAADADAEGPALSYVANVGRPDVLDNASNPTTASDPTHPQNLKANGIFHDARAFPQHDVNMTYLTKGDGASYTLLYTENRNATTWTATNEYEIGFVWAVDSAELGGALDRINSPDTTSTGYRFARPSANHSDIFNNVFADGSVRPLSQEIDLTVFARIMTPNGAATMPAAVAALQSVPVTAADLQP